MRKTHNADDDDLDEFKHRVDKIIERERSVLDRLED